MHSRIYAERFDRALKKMIAAVGSLGEKGLIQASSMPAERDARIQELFRLEFAADALEQLDQRLDGVPVIPTSLEPGPGEPAPEPEVGPEEEPEVQPTSEPAPEPEVGPEPEPEVQPASEPMPKSAKKGKGK